MQPVVIRGLKRSFAVSADRDLPQLAALETTPELPGREPAPEPVAIVSAGDHYRMVFPSGLHVEGSIRECILQADSRILLQATAAERDALMLPAAVVRGPRGDRIGLVGGERTGKTWISLCLMVRGWEIEGDARAVVRLDGIGTLPRTFRLDAKPGLVPPALRRFAENAPLLPSRNSGWARVVDPRRFGSPWRLRHGELSALVFLDRNPGGRGAIGTLDKDTAFRRALALCGDHINALGAAGLRRALANVPLYRLQVGCPEEAAARVAAMSETKG